MNANELADAMEIRASIRRKATSRKSVTEGANDRLADQLEQAATMLRQQADLIRNLQKSLGFKNSGYETINLTPQLKLTDEEIDDTYKKLWDYHLGEKQLITDFRIFARAILRKAQKK